MINSIGPMYNTHIPYPLGNRERIQIDKGSLGVDALHFDPSFDLEREGTVPSSFSVSLGRLVAVLTPHLSTLGRNFVDLDLEGRYTDEFDIRGTIGDMKADLRLKDAPYWHEPTRTEGKVGDKEIYLEVDDGNGFFVNINGNVGDAEFKLTGEHWNQRVEMRGKLGEKEVNLYVYQWGTRYMVKGNVGEDRVDLTIDGYSPRRAVVRGTVENKPTAEELFDFVGPKPYMAYA